MPSIVDFWRNICAEQDPSLVMFSIFTRTFYQNLKNARTWTTNFDENAAQKGEKMFSFSLLQR